MLIFKKDGGEKHIDEESKLIPILIEDGWKCDSIPDVASDDLEGLRKRAEELGIKVHHKAKAETIKAKIDEALNDDSE